MSTLFSEEAFKRCMVSQAEIENVIINGVKMQFDDENGKLTAYCLNGVVYVTEMDILPEAFEAFK